MTVEEFMALPDDGDSPRADPGRCNSRDADDDACSQPKSIHSRDRSEDRADSWATGSTNSQSLADESHSGEAGFRLMRDPETRSSASMSPYVSAELVASDWTDKRSLL